ncbi:MAG: hypothetical protein KDD94_03525 [Calditrichaeota bacterium]|nr:hypothetical protein [Calditrichota bacterium]
MAYDNPHSIRNLGMFIAAVAGFIILIMTFILLIHNLFLPQGGTFQDEGVVFSFVNLFCGTIIFLTLPFLLTGVKIMGFRNWARIGAQIIAALLFLAIWIYTILMSNVIASIEITLMRLSVYGIAVFWSAPCILLIWHLRKPEIKDYFITDNEPGKLTR